MCILRFYPKCFDFNFVPPPPIFKEKWFPSYYSGIPGLLMQPEAGWKPEAAGGPERHRV